MSFPVQISLFVNFPVLRVSSFGFFFPRKKSCSCCFHHLHPPKESEELQKCTSSNLESHIYTLPLSLSLSPSHLSLFLSYSSLGSLQILSLSWQLASPRGSHRHAFIEKCISSRRQLADSTKPAFFAIYKCKTSGIAFNEKHA
jgi:hypothetical protein